MLKNILFTILIIIFFLNNYCKSQELDTMCKNNNEIFFEKFIDTNINTRFTDDNEIYTANKKFTFKYEYIDKNDDKFLYELNNKEWNFVSIDSISDNTIKKIVLKVLPDFGPFNENKSDYHQTVINYTYINNKNIEIKKSFTGLVENKCNIWLHPPRCDLFEILELNPFPYIKYPFEKNNKWLWKLEIGDLWSDVRWKKWEGQITNKYEYCIEETDKLVETNFGELKCIVIKSFAQSRIGTTYLTSYFNIIYGFIRFEYVNIDNSKINIELIEVK